MASIYEEFIDDVSVLPPEIQRRMELIKHLDEKSFGELHDIKYQQQQFLQHLETRMKDRGGGSQNRKIKAVAEDPRSVNPELWDSIRENRTEAERSAQEKIDVSNQCIALIDGYMKKLDSHMESMKEQLQQNGQWDDGATLEALDDSESEANFELPVRQMSNESFYGAGGSQLHRQKPPTSGMGGGATAVVNDTASQVSYIQQQPEAALFCYCQRPSHGRMVGCDNDYCTKEWFHLPCVGLTREPNSESWFCPQCYQELARKRDPRLKKMTDGHGTFVHLSDAEFQQWAQEEQERQAHPGM